MFRLKAKFLRKIFQSRKKACDIEGYNEEKQKEVMPIEGRKHHGGDSGKAGHLGDEQR